MFKVSEFGDAAIFFSIRQFKGDNFVAILDISLSSSSSSSCRLSKAFPGMAVHGTALRIRAVAMRALEGWTWKEEWGSFKL